MKFKSLDYDLDVKGLKTGLEDLIIETRARVVALILALCIVDVVAHAFSTALLSASIRSCCGRRTSSSPCGRRRAPRLRIQKFRFGQTLGIAQVSDTAEQYEANIRRVFGGQGDLFKR